MEIERKIFSCECMCFCWTKKILHLIKMTWERGNHAEKFNLFYIYLLHSLMRFIRCNWLKLLSPCRSIFNKVRMYRWIKMAFTQECKLSWTRLTLLCTSKCRYEYIEEMRVSLIMWTEVWIGKFLEKSYSFFFPQNNSDAEVTFYGKMQKIQEGVLF